MLQSVLGLSKVQTGFDTRNALVVGLDLLAQGDYESHERAAIFERYLSSSK
jgi:hypothetical protein